MINGYPRTENPRVGGSISPLAIMPKNQRLTPKKAPKRADPITNHITDFSGKL
jgi:hypothetical protein